MSNISVETIEKLVSGPTTKTVTYKIDEENSLDIEIKTTLTEKEKISFVEGVADVVFNEDGYSPYSLDASFDLYTVMFFTNLNLPEDFDTQLKITANKDFMNFIKEAIGDGILFNLKMDIVNLVGFKKDEYIAKQNSLGAFVEKINSTLSALAEKLKSADIGKLIQQLNDFDPGKLKSLTGLSEIYNKILETGNTDMLFSENSSVNKPEDDKTYYSEGGEKPNDN